MSKSKIFLIFCIAFIIGVFAGRFINYTIMAIVAMIFIMVGTVWWYNKSVLIFAIASVIILAGAVRFKTDYAQNDLAQFYGQKAQVVGIISIEPDVRQDKIYLTLSHLSVNQHPVRSNLLLTVGPYSHYEYGQKLQFESKIAEPKEYPDFSYKNYLSRFGIDAVAYMPKIDLIPGNFGNPIMAGILKIKGKFVDALGKVLREPQNAFLGGLLLGAKHTIPQTLTDKFNRTGTSHIVAISGYNITIIAVAITGILQWLGVRKRISFGASVLVIILFVIMTGATASAVRAGIMGVLLLLALNVGRVSVAANSLAFTASAMLVINPQILAFDAGFQLSFAAILGIVYLAPLLEPYFLWLPGILRQYFLATLSAQIFTLPILLYNFGQLSIVALLPNLLVLPFVPIAMLTGFLTGVAGLIWIKLSIPFALISWGLLTYILGVIEFFANLKFAAIPLTINFYGLAAYYTILLAVITIYHYRDWISGDFTKVKFFAKLTAIITPRKPDEVK
jgi:competence protein ComEC